MGREQETCRRCKRSGFKESEFLNWHTGLCAECHSSENPKDSTKKTRLEVLEDCRTFIGDLHIASMDFAYSKASSGRYSEKCLEACTKMDELRTDLKNYILQAYGYAPLEEKFERKIDVEDVVRFLRARGLKEEADRLAKLEDK